MNPLALADFESYFRELHGKLTLGQSLSSPPYNWQTRLASRASSGDWPQVIDLPTGSGKTACIDIAVFALACQAALPVAKRTAPRRIFFCVNRRVIVDEACQRARRIAERLRDAEAGALPAPTLARVAAALRQLSTLRPESAPPLDVLELRGGIYRDNRWARSVTQPTIVCTTIDQLGSRLLFRGYGVSPNAAPIQAAMIAYDSLVLLDEAHISRPFLQTLTSVKAYLDPERWAKQRLGVRPMLVVPMTATPPNGIDTKEIIRLEHKDRENQSLDNRLKAPKPARLVCVPDVAKAAVSEVQKYIAGTPSKAIGVIVNRVATARAIYEKLRADHSDIQIELVIGSMRPIDRDRQTERLQPIVGSDRPPHSTQTSVVVATQCLEVGADYDFDVLVTECASLDALRQRFGRLNRAGRTIIAQAVILMDGGAISPKRPDPIYGDALPLTWGWLCANSSVLEPVAELSSGSKRGSKSKKPTVQEPEKSIDFGIDAFRPLFEAIETERYQALYAPSASLNAPIMLPAYVDFWCQTSPRPVPDPEPALFIHGPQPGEPDVQVCWRADLIEDDQLKRTDWCDVVGLLSPTSAECMTVPISRLRRWLTESTDIADQGDLLGANEQAASDEAKKGKDKSKHRLDQLRAGVLWRGARDSKLMTSLDELRPGDTLVLPASANGWDVLGHIPNATPETVDSADTAFRAARDHAVLRLHPSLRSQLPVSPACDELLKRVADRDEPLHAEELRKLLHEASKGLDSRHANFVANCESLAKRKFGLVWELYPDQRGLVLATRRRLDARVLHQLPNADDGGDEASRTSREQPIHLTHHTRHVREEVNRAVGALPIDELVPAFAVAADWHDLGKADERFQAMLRRTDRTDAWLLSGQHCTLLAKSDGMPQTRQHRKEARERAGLPDGFRHEMVSVQIAECDDLTGKVPQRDFILHLIAAHHGHARPFAPVVVDDESPELSVNGVTLTQTNRAERPPHRVNSGITERFWALTRRYGWWGLAYLEAILRLADQQASADEDDGIFDADAIVEPAEALT